MRINNRLSIIVQVIIWFAIFFSPILYLRFDNSLIWRSFFRCLALPSCLFIAYYCNSLWLAPHYFVKGKQRLYFFYNIILIIVLTLVINVWVKWNGSPFSFAHLLPLGRDFLNLPVGTHILMIIHTMFNICVSIVIATMIHLSLNWVKNEDLKNTAIVSQREAELKTLRYQLNPHFMLNTLNNIYALTAFNQKKAQYAIMELSKMLRHILYENDRPYLDIEDEVTFIHSYVNLMKLRLSEQVEIKEDYNVPSSKDIHIVPMLLISLVENAFKHGVSPTKKSFIHIKIQADKEKIVCEIVNSYYPKTKKDKSGSGVGIQSVQRRLDLLYTDHYNWEKGTNNNQNIYSSKITLYDTQLRNY